MPFRPALLLAALAAACATPRPPDAPRTHAMYEGSRPPKLGEMAVLLVYPPPDVEGKTLVGRITSDATGEDYRPPTDTRLLELEPGRYRLETYFWVARSHLERDAKGKEALVIENLQSAKIAPMEIHVEAGRTYYVRPELRRREDVPAGERSGFFPLNQGTNVTDPELLRRGEATVIDESPYVWRPHLAVLPPDRAQPYRAHRK